MGSQHADWAERTPPFPRTNGTYSVLAPQDTTQRDTTFRGEGEGERGREREREREEGLVVSGLTHRSMRAYICETCQNKYTNGEK